MAKTGKSLTDLAREIERRAEAKRDLIAPVTKLAMQVNRTADDKPLPVLTVSNGRDESFPLQPHAHGQVAEYAGIPMAYYRRMMADAPDLLAANVNRWLADLGTQRRMVRTLDGNVRAVLSDGYRPLENEDLAEVILPVLLERDLLILSCEITERRLYIKAVDRSIERDVPTGKAMGDGSHVFFDTCSPAITISNSEVGSGALSVETGVYTRVCTNLAMMGANMRKFHTGKRAELSDEVYQLLTSDTKKATDKAVWMQTRDLVTAAFDLAKFDATLKRLGAAAEDRIEPQVVTEVIERVGRKFAFNEGERKGILARLIEGADLTRYGIHSAITRHSADVEDYDRATELERIGGDVIELAANDWRALAAA
jgi:hypothetical protein